MRSNLARAVLVVAAVSLLAGALRLYRLGDPSEKVFDEVYYASDGCLVAGFDHRECGLAEDAERSWVHPPLGKTLIAVGIDGVGNRPFGWRVAAAAAGTATVGAVGALAYLLLGRALWAGLAALLVATEHLHFVQSRISMLDIFLAFFVVLGFAFLVADRRRGQRWVPHPDRDGAPSFAGTADSDAPDVVRLGSVRPLRLLAGVSLGLAVAVKWSGVFALLGAILLALGWNLASLRTRRAGGADRVHLRRVFRAENASVLLGLVVVPAAAYLLAWLPWLADRGFDLGGWWETHMDAARYHFTLDPVEESGEAIHPYMSSAWSWFLLLRPVAYHWEGSPDCCAEILGIGHPLLFWGALAMLPYLAAAWWGRRDWRAGAVLVPVLAQYLPWLLVTRPLFLFYMTPVTPFLSLGAAYVLRDVAGWRVGRWRAGSVVATAAVVAAVGLFAFFWPVLVGEQITYESWRARMWLGGWV